MIFDNLFAKAFLDELRKYSNKKDMFGNMTYQLIYNLIKENKIRISFNVAPMRHSKPIPLPDISFGCNDKKKPTYKYNNRSGTVDVSEAFCATDILKGAGRLGGAATIKLGKAVWDAATSWDVSTKLIIKSGGYNPFNKSIDLVVWFYAGIEWEKIIFGNLFPSVYIKILSAILNEGIIIYNNHYNSVVVDNDKIRNWYKTYFISTLMKSTGRTTVSRFIGNRLGEVWPEYIFNNIERSIVRGEKPAMMLKNTKDVNVEYIQQKPLITKYLEDPLKKIIRSELPERFDLDQETATELESYIKDFSEFASFMYFNKDKQFRTEDLKKVPKFNFVIKNASAKTWNNCLGFKIVGDSEEFDNAYDTCFDIKDVYEDKGYFKKNYVFSEIFMPSIIQSKYVYYTVLRDVVNSTSLKLINNAVTGLSFL